MTRHRLFAFPLLGVLLGAVALAGRGTGAQGEQYDLVLTGGRVLDPETALDAPRNVGIRDGRIAAVTVEPLAARETLAVAGLVVAPGFIQGRTIASHLATAAEVGGVDVPQQLIATAVAHGTAGDIAAARQAAEKLATAAQSDSQYVTASRTANAIILLRENKPKEALNQLSGAKADDPLVRALLAECYRATGNTADGSTLRSQVINDPQVNLIDAYATIARVRAARIKA